jgi:hypothetical protein
MDGFSLFTETLAGMSSLRWHVRGLGIYGCGSLFPSFSLMRSNRRIKADIIGPNAQSGRFPAMSAGPAHPTRLRFGVPIFSERSSHVMPAWIRAAVGIYGCGYLVPSP